MEFFCNQPLKRPMCDGVGGTVKRLAAKASLQRCAELKLDEQILTPTAFYDFCKKNIVNIEFVYATNEDYEGEYQLLQDDQEGRLRRELLSLGVESDSQDTISGEFQARDSRKTVVD